MAFGGDQEPKQQGDLRIFNHTNDILNHGHHGLVFIYKGLIKNEKIYGLVFIYK